MDIRNEELSLNDDVLIMDDEKLRKEIRSFTACLDVYPRSKRRDILHALHWSKMLHEGQKRDSGEPYIIHPIRTAEILIRFRMDPSVIKGALLHDVLEDTDISKQDLVDKFGDEVAALVEGVTKIEDMNIGKSVSNAVNFRKMVWAIVDDLRVIFIKLADKCHNMHTLQYVKDDKRRLRIARECLEIYVPMAGKLGMRTLKTELEDLSFKYLFPDSFNQIQAYVTLEKEERKFYLEKVQGDLLRAASKAKLRIRADTRVKNFYSIYHKMKKRGKEIDEIYDLLGMRIICDSTETCYTTLGIVHCLWVPLEGRFKDYIAHPKGNGYRSLHTTVLTDGGKPLEVQIRSQLMHETAEFGIAAHWAYKEGKKNNQAHTEQIAMVKQLITLSEEGHDYDAGEFLEAIKRDVLRDSIIVYTPKGDPVELPIGSTAIDFAYHIHTEIGEHCMGAKADGSIIPLTRRLENTQNIQILTSPSAHPHVNWLKHLQSARARSKVRNWLNRHDADVVVDRNIVARKKTADSAARESVDTEKLQTQVINATKIGVRTENEHNIMIEISQCCSPNPGDRIIGYISRGRGIIVHNVNCPNLKGIHDFEKRKIQVDWEIASAQTTQRFSIHSRYTPNLFSEIESAIRKYRGRLISGSLDETERGDLSGFFIVEMQSKEDFKKISRSIRAIPPVLSISKGSNLVNQYHE